MSTKNNQALITLYDSNKKPVIEIKCPNDQVKYTDKFSICRPELLCYLLDTLSKKISQKNINEAAYIASDLICVLVGSKDISENSNNDMDWFSSVNCMSVECNKKDECNDNESCCIKEVH